MLREFFSYHFLIIFLLCPFMKGGSTYPFAGNVMWLMGPEIVNKNQLFLNDGLDTNGRFKWIFWNISLFGSVSDLSQEWLKRYQVFSSDFPTTIELADFSGLEIICKHGGIIFCSVPEDEDLAGMLSAKR